MNAKQFQIPSDFRSISDVTPDIYEELITKGKYVLKSTVSTAVLDSFVNHWVNNDPPYICSDNLSEYIILSDEFDRMKNLINTYQKRSPNNEISSLLACRDNLLQEKKLKKSEIEEKTDEYRQIIHLILNNFMTNSLTTSEKAQIKDYRTNDKILKSLLSKKIDDGYLSFFLNEEDKTASVTNSINCVSANSILIPKSIMYENEEYIVNGIHFSMNLNPNMTINFSEDSIIQVIEKFAFFHLRINPLKIPSSVTCISDNAFMDCDVKSIEFMEDSKLISIGKGAFDMSSIESLTIPSSVVSFGEDWCNRTKIRNIKILEKEQKNISYFDDKFIIGKSDLKSDTFDVLLFARRDIKTAIIPSFIKRIAPYAFDFCTQLQTVEFQSDSSLQMIDKKAFSFSTLERITIPSSVVLVEDSAFNGCERLQIFDLHQNSKLKVIGPKAFSSSNIKSISIPSNIVSLKKGWCNETKKLTDVKILNNGQANISYYDNKFIIGKSDLKSDTFDVLLFARRDIETAIIPSFIKRIAPYAFDFCTQLQTVEFSSDSSLQIIDKSAFSFTSLNVITLPSSVVEIGKNAFENCDDIQKIEFSMNSKLRTIHNDAFIDSSLTSITLPSSVSDLKPFWCRGMSWLKNIKIIQSEQNIISCYDDKFIIGKSNPKTGTFDVLLFARRDIRIATIPSFIKRIAPFAFSECDKLISIDFEPNSQLELINQSAFEDCNLERIFIPSSVSRIEPSAFYCNLEIIEFGNDSKLREFETHIFVKTFLKSIIIPKNVSRISKDAFFNTRNIQVAEIPENSEITDISGLKSQFVMIPCSMRKKINV